MRCRLTSRATTRITVTMHEGDLRRRGADTTDGDERVLDLAWPDGVPEGERRYMALLSEEQRRVALSRLEAIVVTDLPLVERMRLAGGSRAQFYRFRSAWSKKRSISSLVPYARRPARRGGEFPEAEAAASREAARDPGDSVQELSERVRATLADPPSMVVLRRIAGDARRRVLLRADDLAARIGRGFAVEYVATDVPLAVDGGAEWAHAAIVVERASGLVLGWAIGSAADAGGLVDLAGARSVGSPDAERVARVATGDAVPSLDVRIPNWSQDGPGLVVLIARIKAVAGDGSARETRAYGGYLSEAVGFRLGGIRLEPGPAKKPATRLMTPAEARRSPPVDWREAERRMADAVHRHNTPIRERLDAMAESAGRYRARDLFEALMSWASLTAEEE